MKNLLLITILTLCTAATAAQCNNFNCAYKEAQRLLNSSEKDKYTKAMAYLDDAENFAGADKAQYEKVRALRKKAFVAIEKERKEAVEARLAADKAKEEALAEKTKAEAAEQKANAVLDKIYFYEGKYGLAYDNKAQFGLGVYGFIDKNLNTKIDFLYSEAQPFDYTGFAKVKKNNEYYLIDTTGKEYRLATDIVQLDKSTAALDLRGKDLVNIPSQVCEHLQLEILLLTSNQITTLPPEIGKLENWKN